ncbi:phage tail protein, partial [Yersinia enterocolitica]
MQKIGDIPNTRADNNGEFTDGNVAGGVPPTILPAEWFNTIQRELMSILNAAEIESDPHVFNQVLLSIQKLVSEGIPDLKDASLTQKGIVQLSNATNSTSQTLAATPKAVSDLGNLLLKITNNLSEIKDAGPAAVAQTLLNLGLGDTAKRNIGTGNANVPDIAAADNRYLKQSGGKVTGDSAPIIIRAATLNAALYLLAQQSDGSGAWYLGMPVAENNKLALRSYANNCEISLSLGRGDITVPLYIEGGKAYYPGNKPPLTNVWVSGEYTPVMATPTVVNHGLAGIDVLHCKADVLLKCVTADAGYSPGDFAAG